MKPMFHRGWAIAALGVWLSAAPLACATKEAPPTATRAAEADKEQSKSRSPAATAAPAAEEAEQPKAAFDGPRRGAAGAKRAASPGAPAEIDGNSAPVGKGINPGGGEGVGGTGEKQPTARPAPPAASQALIPIDPNGRFATTYRPAAGTSRPSSRPSRAASSPPESASW